MEIKIDFIVLNRPFHWCIYLNYITAVPWKSYSVFFSSFQYALQELEELKQIVPKESLVYFLIGKVKTILSIIFWMIAVRT